MGANQLFPKNRPKMSLSAPFCVLAFLPFCAFCGPDRSAPLGNKPACPIRFGSVKLARPIRRSVFRNLCVPMSRYARLFVHRGADLPEKVYTIRKFFGSVCAWHDGTVFSAKVNTGTPQMFPLRFDINRGRFDQFRS